jgi:stage III sporulation protein AE
MKIIKAVVLILSVVFLCSFDRKESENENISLHNAENYTYSEKKTERFDGLVDEARDELSGIYEGFLEALPDGVPKSSEEISGRLGVEEALSWISSLFTSEESVGVLLTFLSSALLFSIAELFLSHTGTGIGAAAILLSIPVIRILAGAVSEVSEGLFSLSETFSALVPTLTALISVGSGGGAAAVSGAGMSFSLGLISGVLAECLLPLSAMIFASSITSSVDTLGVTEGAVKGIRGLFGFLVGLSSLVIVAIFGAQTFIAVSADNLALKSAKYAVSGMIPVVGGAVSGTLSALISGVKLLSATVGTVSVFALLFVVITPVAKLLFLRLCLWVSISVASFSGGGAGVRLFTSLRSALDTLVAILVSSSLVCLLEVIIVTVSIRGAL